MTTPKALARFLYARVPGLATARFIVKDLTAASLMKQEYQGVSAFSLGDDLIVDIGANRGQSIAAFRKLAPRAPIIAFEPEPGSVRRIAVRYQADPTVRIEGSALGAENGKITFFVPSYGYWACDGMSATSHEAATEWLRDPGRMYRFNPSLLTVAQHSIQCRTLDSYRLAPKLIKIHAQGAEPDILRGALQTIEHHRPALMCAFPPPKVTEFLAAFGYRPYCYRHNSFMPGVADRSVTFTWYLTDNHTRQLSADRLRLCPP